MIKFPLQERLLQCDYPDIGWKVINNIIIKDFYDTRIIDPAI